MAAEHIFEPQAADRAVYDERYGTYLEIHKRVRPLYRRIDRDTPAKPGGVRGAL
jgi:xylulokinase